MPGKRADTKVASDDSLDVNTFVSDGDERRATIRRAELDAARNPDLDITPLGRRTMTAGQSSGASGQFGEEPGGPAARATTVYDNAGRDGGGFDREGYDNKGRDGEGYDREGFNKKGRDREDHDREGFNKKHIDKEGYTRGGFHSETGKDREGYYPNGFPGRDGHVGHVESFGYDREGFDFYGRDGDGYNRAGYDYYGVGRDGTDQNGYPAFGDDDLNRRFHHADGGRDRDGYDRGGYDQRGYTKQGYDSDGFGRDGHDCFGYDKAGAHESSRSAEAIRSDLLHDMRCIDGGDRNAAHRFKPERKGRNGIEYDSEGYDIRGLNQDGFTQMGRDRNGYRRNRGEKLEYNRHGYDGDGYNRGGVDRLGYDRFGKAVGHQPIR